MAARLIRWRPASCRSPSAKPRKPSATSWKRTRTTSSPSAGAPPPPRRTAKARSPAHPTSAPRARPSPPALATFIGEIDQVPPQFSAIKVNGERAYDLARDGETVDLASRKVNLYAAELVDCPSPDLAVIRVTCGKGFYIRALVRDIAAALGAEGHVAALRRTRVGAFAEAAAITLPFLQQMSDKPALDDTLVPLETALDDIPALAITGEEASRLRQGREIVLLPHQVEAFREMRRPRQVNGEDASRICLATEKVGEEQLGVALGEVRAGRFMPVRVFNQ